MARGINLLKVLIVVIWRKKRVKIYKNIYNLNFKKLNGKINSTKNRRKIQKVKGGIR
jgi:hypothetical protein